MADVDPKDFSVWSDHLKQQASAAAKLQMAEQQISKLDAESVQKNFEADLFKISHDTATYMQYTDLVTKSKRNQQLAKVCHVRAENKRGAGAVLEYMSQQSRHDIGLYTDVTALEGIKKAYLLA